jgi:hypothetical protein
MRTGGWERCWPQQSRWDRKPDLGECARQLDVEYGHWAMGGSMFGAVNMALEEDAHRRLGEVLATAVKVRRDTRLQLLSYWHSLFCC